MIITHISETGAVHIEDTDAPQPFPSWIKKHNGLGSYWDAPVPCPLDEKTYIWSEEELTWKEADNA